MSEDLTGSRLGHYKIDGILGRGGMSVMYRATDTRLGRKVALKVMGNHITDDAEFRERFVDEARNTSAIDHPNIVPLYDFGEVDDMLYIALRLVEGSDLAGLVASGPLSARRALELLEQVAEALDMLHERGLVHLDLKPANVLVTARESTSEHVYLADFGLTRRGATGHRTSSGDFLGSPTYAAPEHLRGEPVDGRTDLYALACMLFACLTGRAPFQGEIPQIIQGHLSSPPPSVAAAVPVPSAVDEVLRVGMAKAPRQRFGTCRELIGAAWRAFGSGTGQSPDGTPLPGGLASGGAPDPRTPAPGTPVPGQQPGPGGPGPPAFLPGTPPPQAVQPPPVPGNHAPGPQPGPQPGPPAGQAPAGYSPPPGSVPQNADPVRLRPPMPVHPPSIATTASGGTARWLVPLLVGVALLVIVVLFVVLATSAG